MNDLKTNRLVQAFAELRAAGKKTLVPFLTAGYPDLAATRAMLEDFEARGVRVAELGIPFSDPIADGPVIQSSYTEVLASGQRTDQVLEMVREYREGGGKLGLAAMVSFSIVFRHGLQRFLDQCSQAGVDAVLIPDLPLNEAGEVEKLARSRGLANIMLIAPTTQPPRRLEIARHSTGFVYYVSIAGITGERDRLSEATLAAVAELRTHVDLPICVGFGVSNPATVAEVCRVAEGAIVGSAIVHRIQQHKDLPPAELAARIGAFVSELLAPVL